MATTHAPLLDTDVLIDYLRGHPQAVAFVSALPDIVYVSSITVAELHVGVREGPERVALADLLSTFRNLDISSEMAQQAGLLRRDYGRSHGVGLNDCLIAATALAHNLQVCTLNVKHFPSLKKAQLKQAYVKK